jgi:DnaA regulatory inactivator Hda
VTRQLPLALTQREVRGRAALFVSPANALAVAAVDGWRDWPEGKAVLCGPPGSGKSHLGHVWAEEAGAATVAARDLAGADLRALAGSGAVLVEDADRIGGDAAAETALFHLHNMLGAARAPLLVTAALPPRDWRLRLPDLETRMQAAPLIRLDPPDDALLSATLVKLLADRQLHAAPGVIDWLMQRMPRSLQAARTIVAALDARSLADRRPVTVALARAVLDTLAEDAAGRA